MLDHIELYVRDLKISRHFYDKLLSLLGFNIYQEWDLGFSYMKDSFYIVFVQTEEKYLSNNYHRKSAGLNHLAFKVNSLAEVDLIKKEMSEISNELYKDRYPNAGGNNYAYFFEDPDRIKLEVVFRK